VEILTLVLSLMLFYFLLRQRMIESIVAALVVISVKEDAPIAAAIVAIVAGVETWFSSADKRARYRFNWPAAVTLLLSVLAVPLLLAISWSQSPTATRLIDKASRPREVFLGLERSTFSSPPIFITGLIAASSVNGYGL
jgi:hypothetical protein